MIPAKKKRVAFRVIEGEALLVFLDDTAAAGESLYVLNDTATAIWELINGKRTVPQIAAALTKEYEISQKEAVLETQDFIDTLSSLQIVTLHPHKT